MSARHDLVRAARLARAVAAACPEPATYPAFGATYGVAADELTRAAAGRAIAPETHALLCRALGLDPEAAQAFGVRS